MSHTTTYRDRIAQRLTDEANRQDPGQTTRETKTHLMKYYHEVLNPDTEAHSRICLEELKKVMQAVQARKDAERAAREVPLFPGPNGTE